MITFFSTRNAISNWEHDGYQQDDDSKKPRTSLYYNILSVIVTKQEGNHNERYYHQYACEECDDIAPQRAPTPIVIEPLNDVVNLWNIEVYSHEFILQMKDRLKDNREKAFFLCSQHWQ